MNGRCYFVNTTAGTYTESEAYCRGSGGNLMQFRNASEIAYAQAQILAGLLGVYVSNNYL